VRPPTRLGCSTPALPPTHHNGAPGAAHSTPTCAAGRSQRAQAPGPARRARRSLLSLRARSRGAPRADGAPPPCGPAPPQVWVKPLLNEDGTLQWRADSDSQLTKVHAACSWAACSAAPLPVMPLPRARRPS
jgi:hypothetical protein